MMIFAHARFHVSNPIFTHRFVVFARKTTKLYKNVAQVRVSAVYDRGVAQERWRPGGNRETHFDPKIIGGPVFFYHPLYMGDFFA